MADGLDLDALEAVADAYGDGIDGVYEFDSTFDDQTVKALIARVRAAEGKLKLQRLQEAKRAGWEAEGDDGQG